MIKSLVNAIKEQAEHIANIKTFKYEGRDLINAQNNNYTTQIWFEDDIYTQYLITKDLVKVTINIDILDKVYQQDSSLDVHNTTYKIGIVLMKLMDKAYPNIISVADYSLMSLSHYTDDDLFGHRLTLDLYMPSPINECNIDDYIDEDNRFIENTDNEITINTPTINIDNIDLNPIKLRRNGE